jgi:hypothetical protein
VSSDVHPVMCCFCGETVEDAGPDPCALMVWIHWRRPEDEQMSQQFFAHADCLRSRMVESAAKSAPTLDLSWEA